MTNETANRIDWRTIERTSAPGTPERCALYIAGQIPAYVDPAPPGGLGREARDALAMELGRKWAAKVARGETSCAWHEVSEHYGTLARCPCMPCEKARAAKGGAA